MMAIKSVFMLSSLGVSYGLRNIWTQDSGLCFGFCASNFQDPDASELQKVLNEMMNPETVNILNTMYLRLQYVLRYNKSFGFYSNVFLILESYSCHGA